MSNKREKLNHHDLFRSRRKFITKDIPNFFGGLALALMETGCQTSKEPTAEKFLDKKLEEARDEVKNTFEPKWFETKNTNYRLNQDILAPLDNIIFSAAESGETMFIRGRVERKPPPSVSSPENFSKGVLFLVHDSGFQKNAYLVQLNCEDPQLPCKPADYGLIDPDGQSAGQLTFKISDGIISVSIDETDIRFKSDFHPIIPNTPSPDHELERLIISSIRQYLSLHPSIFKVSDQPSLPDTPSPRPPPPPLPEKA